jgi:(S)-sulfolactate dehydrogenase
MPDIVVTEFFDPEPLETLKRAYSVHVDTALWGKVGELEALMSDARGIIVRNRTQVTAALIAKAPKLQVVGRLGVGLDNIDLPACAARNITVCPAIGANAVSVAEFVIGSALMLARSAAYFGSAALVGGKWPREAAGNGWEITGKRLGIIGYGNIGQTVAGRARAMGMTVAAFDDYMPASSPAWKDATACHVGRRVSALSANAGNKEYARRDAPRTHEEGRIAHQRGPRWCGRRS